MQEKSILQQNKNSPFSRKAEIQRVIGGLSMMTFFTVMWSAIAEIDLAGRDHWIVGVVFWIIVIVFIKYYIKFKAFDKSLPAEPAKEQTLEEKKRGKWF